MNSPPAGPRTFPDGEAYRAGGVAPTAEKAAADIGWREFFTDPRLQQLIPSVIRQYNVGVGFTRYELDLFAISMPSFPRAAGCPKLTSAYRLRDGK
jgi:multidrug efflux system outer membrane protein